MSKKPVTSTKTTPVNANETVGSGKSWFDSEITWFGHTLTAQYGTEVKGETFLGDKYSVKMYQGTKVGKKGVFNSNITKFQNREFKHDYSINIGTYSLSLNTTDLGFSTSLSLFGVGISSGASLLGGYSGGLSYTGENKITNGMSGSFRGGGFTLIGVAMMILVPKSAPFIPALAR
ncbi:hypothetical protein, partial [Pararcticibacter amylolyticus]|uniref:hypothetical protein n=1 Tax=Pararcticibacter amylolyticus TaxID=2173175 RepID=UPI001EE3C5BA